MGLDRNKRSPGAARPDLKLHRERQEKVGTDLDLANPLVPEDVVKTQEMIRLTERDWELFLASLESDARPNRALQKAAERFKRFYR